MPESALRASANATKAEVAMKEVTAASMNKRRVHVMERQQSALKPH